MGEKHGTQAEATVTWGLVSGSPPFLTWGSRIAPSDEQGACVCVGGGVACLLHVRHWPGQRVRSDLQEAVPGQGRVEFETPATGRGGLRGWNRAHGLRWLHRPPIPSHAALGPAEEVVGAGRSPPLSHAFPRGPGAPSPSQVSLFLPLDTKPGRVNRAAR